MQPEREFDLKSLSEVAEQYQYERSEPKAAPIQLGLADLDADMRSFSHKKVLIVCAATGTGKTQAQNSMVDHITRRHPDAGVLILSLEMPDTDWFERQYAIADGIAPESVESMARDKRLLDSMDDFNEQFRHVLICDSNLALRDVPRVIDAARERLPVPVRVVVIDYLTLLGSEGKSEYERASFLGVNLKRLAKSSDVALIVAAQLSRAADGYSPVTRHQLRDSGKIEEGADYIIGLWSPGDDPGLSDPERWEWKGKLQAALIKNRFGPANRPVTLAFDHPSRALRVESGVADLEREWARRDA
jgi:replicative DNA helicase